MNEDWNDVRFVYAEYFLLEHVYYLKKIVFSGFYLPITSLVHIRYIVDIHKYCLFVFGHSFKAKHEHAQHVS